MNRQGSLDHRGCRLAYDVRGSGPPVLMIQGVGVHGAGWSPQVDGLAGRFECLCFDNRGMGRSRPAGMAITVAGMADDARAILDREGWRSAHVVGHSLGGLVALQLALDDPGRVRSLSLLCTFAGGRDAAPLTLRMAWAGARSRVGTRRMRRLGFLRLVMTGEALRQHDPEELAARLAPLFGHDLADQPPIVGDQLAAMRACQLADRLGALAGLPTLVVSGRHDPIAPPRSGKALAAAIPGSRYVELPDASHGAPIQCADAVNALLIGHLTAAEGPASGPVTARRPGRGPG